jgi:hypothetical protein
MRLATWSPVVGKRCVKHSPISCSGTAGAATVLSCNTTACVSAPATAASAAELAAAAELLGDFVTGLGAALPPTRVSTTVDTSPGPLGCNCDISGPNSSSPVAITASAPQRLLAISSTVSTGLLVGLLWSCCVDGDTVSGFLVAWLSSQGLTRNSSCEAEALLVVNRVLPVDSTQYRPSSVSWAHNSCLTCDEYGRSC